MSIWVSFHYAPASPGQKVEEKYATAQAVAFVELSRENQEILDAYTPFTAEYLAHLEEEEERFEAATAGLPEADRVFAYTELGSGLDWGEGSKPFDPELLLQWATRWRQVLDCASDDELAELLCGVEGSRSLPMWDFAVKQWKQDMDDYQQFARQAMADRVLLTMSVG